MTGTLFTLFCGLVFGSFVTCASYRLPRGEDVALKASRCTRCEAKLGFKDLWPVLSWLISKGQCRHCGTRVSVRYPVIELVTAVLFLLIYSQYGLTAQGILLALMSVALLIMIIVDLEHYIIPDEIHYALLPLGLIWHFVIGTPPLDVAEGLLIGLVIGLTLRYGYRVLRRKEGLGFGDVKFFAVAGLWLTPCPIVPFLFSPAFLVFSPGCYGDYSVGGSASLSVQHWRWRCSSESPFQKYMTYYGI